MKSMNGRCFELEKLYLMHISHASAWLPQVLAASTGGDYFGCYHFTICFLHGFYETEGEILVHLQLSTTEASGNWVVSAGNQSIILCTCFQRGVYSWFIFSDFLWMSSKFNPVFIETSTLLMFMHEQLSIYSRVHERL